MATTVDRVLEDPAGKRGTLGSNLDRLAITYFLNLNRSESKICVTRSSGKRNIDPDLRSSSAVGEPSSASVFDRQSASREFSYEAALVVRNGALSFIH